jgi:hypothetical protein
MRRLGLCAILSLTISGVRPPRDVAESYAPDVCCIRESYRDRDRRRRAAQRPRPDNSITRDRLVH